MRNLKRVLSLALALVMVLGMMVISTSAATFAEEEIENVEAVEVMNALGIVKGDGGKFYPDRVLTREEAAKIMAYVTLGPDVEKYLTGSAAPFDDVKADRWSAKYIAYCKNLGIINGMGDGTFAPKDELTVVGFGKLLLGAIGYDTTKYVGGGWVNAVKDDMADAKLDIVEFDDKTPIDRDTACQMALIAMKAELVDAEEKWIVKEVAGTEKTLKTFSDMLEAYTYANALNTAKGDVDYCEAVLDTTEGTLLGKVYNVDYVDDEDIFGRPGKAYESVEEDGEFYEFFVSDYAYKFVGTFNEDAIEDIEFAEPYEIVYNGGNDVNITAVDDLYYADGNAATGITVELYLNSAKKVNKVVAYEANYAVIGEVTEAEGETPASIAVEVYYGTLTNSKTSETLNVKDTKATDDMFDVLSAYEKDDVVAVYCGPNWDELYDEDDAIIGTVIAVEDVTVVEGKVTKVVLTETAHQGTTVITVGGKEYATNSNCYGATSITPGTDCILYLDTLGNVLYVDAPEDDEPEEPEVFYGLFLDAAGLLYKEAESSTLVGDGNAAKEAKEVIKLLTAEGKEVVFDTAWEYKDELKADGSAGKDGKTDKVVFVNADPQTEMSPVNVESYSPIINVDDDAGKLVAYTLTEDGKIATIAIVEEDEEYDEVVASALTTGKVLMTGNTTPMSDNTLFFVTIDDETYIYTGYKNVPSLSYIYTIVGLTTKIDGVDTYEVLCITGVAADPVVDEEAPSYIYFAGVNPTQEWDAEAEEVVYVYANVYVDGVKLEGGLVVGDPLEGIAAGEMYTYAVDEDGEVSIGAEDVLTGTYTVTLIQPGFFMDSNSADHYVDDATVYYQITNTGIVEVEGLPAVKNFTSTIKFVIAGEDTDAVIYFTAEAIEE